MDEEIKVWSERLAEADNAIALHSENWEGYYELFQGITVSDEAEKELRADVHIPIVGPMVHTFTARELMAFFGRSDSITVELSGKGEEDYMRELARRTRKGLSFLWSEPHVFSPLYNAITDKNVYGNVGIKVMPYYNFKGEVDKTRIFDTEIMDKLNFLFDPNANKWERVEWAGHRKVVSLQYLKSRYGKEARFKKIEKILREDMQPSSGNYGEVESKKGIELMEIWDRVNSEVLTFINRKYLIRKEKPFPYMFPFIMGQCFTESNTPWAYGIPKVLMWIQDMADELINLRLDDLIRNVHTRWVVPSHLYSAMLNAGPGKLIENTRGMDDMPKALSGEDVTQNLSIEVDGLKNSAYSTMGISPWTQINIPSKRMTTPEVMLTEKGSGRAWSVMKTSESNFWLPWAERVVALMIKYAGDDFFDKTSGKISMKDTPGKYKDFGPMAPKDLKKFHPQIQAKMASDMLAEEEKRVGVAQYLSIISQVAPQFLRTGYSLRRLGETLDIPGIEKMLKTDEEIAEEKKQLLEELAARQAAGQAGAGGVEDMGRGSIFREGGR